MGCNCGGGGRKQSAERGSLFVLTLPTGRKKTYANEADAKRAKARLGGEISVKPR